MNKAVKFYKLIFLLFERLRTKKISVVSYVVCKATILEILEGIIL